MHTYQLIIIVITMCIIIKCRGYYELIMVVLFHIASVFTYYYISSSEYNIYYVVMCALSLHVGACLGMRFFVASLCSYLMVIVGVIGYILWYKYYPPDLYNVLSAIILIIQFVSILPKVLLNGMDRPGSRYFMDEPVSFDSYSPCDTMPKIQTDQKTICAKV